MHTLVVEHGELVGHVAVVRRRLLHQDRPVRTGYVEALAVRGDRRRRGYAGAAMGEVERVIANGYDLGALSDGSGIDLNWTTPWDEHTPLDMARASGAEDLVEWLRGRGARSAGSGER